MEIATSSFNYLRIPFFLDISVRLLSLSYVDMKPLEYFQKRYCFLHSNPYFYVPCKDVGNRDDNSQILNLIKLSNFKEFDQSRSKWKNNLSLERSSKKDERKQSGAEDSLSGGKKEVSFEGNRVGCGSERDIAHPRATPGSLAARACMHKACTLDGPRTLNSRACVRARQTHFPAARFSRDASPPPSRYFSYTSSFLVSVGFNERIVIRLSVDSSNSKEFEMGLLSFLQDSLLSSCCRLSRIERGTLSESWSPLEYSSRKMKNFEGSRISKYRYLKKKKETERNVSRIYKHRVCWKPVHERTFETIKKSGLHM